MLWKHVNISFNLLQLLLFFLLFIMVLLIYFLLYIVYNIHIYIKCDGDFMDIELKENERIDDLEYRGLKIIQNKNGFCFGIDSVLISDFAKRIKSNSIVADLGTGTGIISILVAGKTKAKKIYGVEIQNYVANMAKRSIILNNLSEKVSIINEDIKKIDIVLGIASCDVIITNPPYKKMGTGLLNEDMSKLISRHEIKCTLEDVIEKSFKVLKDRGEFYMVHRPDRLVDIIYIMRKNKIEPKEIRLVHSNENSEPKLVLIKGIKNARSELKIDKPLYIYNLDGTYTDEILEIYNKNRR